MTEGRLNYEPGCIVRYMGKHGMMAGYYIRHVRGQRAVILDSPEAGRQLRIREDRVLATRPRRNDA